VVDFAVRVFFSQASNEGTLSSQLVEFRRGG